MYDINGTSNSFINKYGIKIINPEKENSQSGIIVGKNKEITFGSNTDDISFYFINQNITFNNIEPLNYQYNSVLEKLWSFYTQDISSSISILNFSNIGIYYRDLHNKNIIVIKKGKNIDFMIIDMGLSISKKNILDNANKLNKKVLEGYIIKKSDENKKLYIALANLIKNGEFDVIS